MRYEVLITAKQPTCGGRAPTKSEIRMVETNDPEAYVRAQEQVDELEVETADDGMIIVRLTRNGLWVRYEFTED
ncbi:MAG: hypothetical protein IIY16_07565 [Oscillospiraceae bacterium]|nr:hypothetical protein [Oscillospiraceae bacterium]